MATLLIALLLLFPPDDGQRGYGTAPIPSWVKLTDSPLSPSGDGGSGGIRILLSEYQEEIERQQIFVRSVVLVRNSDGVKSAADISVTYDPTFQTVHFCRMAIHRGRTTVDRLGRDPIEIYRRASDAESERYDKTVEATIHLAGVRAGDIVESAYYVRGYVPSLRGRCFGFHGLEYNVAIDRLIFRFLSPEGRGVIVRHSPDLPDPAVRSERGTTEHLWDLRDLSPLQVPEDTPSWYFPQRYIAVSEFATWGEVARWAAPMYRLERKEIAAIRKASPVRKGGDRSERILDLIRFVQDEVRYVSVMSGLCGYAPAPPRDVLERRYGDCKEKSLLLVALLRGEGIEATPLLVNSTLRAHVASRLPSPGVFDHCVVMLDAGERRRFVDPTLSNQGGGLDSLWFPPYEVGLAIDSSATELISLPVVNRNTVNVEEELEVRGFDSSATYRILTRYGGHAADKMRGYMNTATEEQLRTASAEYYRGTYPDIQAVIVPTVVKDDRGSSNTLTVEEKFTIPAFWRQSGADSGTVTASVTPVNVEEVLSLPRERSRRSPWYIGEPVTIRMWTKIVMPTDWSFSIAPFDVRTSAFDYHFDGECTGRVIRLRNEYIRSVENVPAEEVTAVAEKVEEVNNQLVLRLRREKPGGDFALSAMGILVALVAMVAAVGGAVWVYLRVDPPPRVVDAGGRRIGGWLILVAFAVLLTPFRLAWAIWGNPVWLNAQILDANAASGLSHVILVELALNITFIVFSVLTAVLFFRRRTNFPVVFTAFLVGNILFLGFDLVIGRFFTPDRTYDTEGAAALFRTILGAIIWIPYLFLSNRSKETFVVSRVPVRGGLIEVGGDGG